MSNKFPSLNNRVKAKVNKKKILKDFMTQAIPDNPLLNLSNEVFEDAEKVAEHWSKVTAWMAATQSDTDSQSLQILRIMGETKEENKAKVLKNLWLTHLTVLNLMRTEALKKAEERLETESMSLKPDFGVIEYEEGSQIEDFKARAKMTEQIKEHLKKANKKNK